MIAPLLHVPHCAATWLMVLRFKNMKILFIHNTILIQKKTASQLVQGILMIMQQQQEETIEPNHQIFIFL
jgi:hypothetical protein